MAKTKQSFTGNQVDIFQQLAKEDALEAATAVDMNIEQEFIGALNYCIRAAKNKGLSRERIVERMNLCLQNRNRAVTLRQLNAWTAASKEYSDFPGWMLPAFCWACSGDLTIQVLAQTIGRDLVDKREQIALELGQTLVQSANLTRKANDLKKQLTGE